MLKIVKFKTTENKFNKIALKRKGAYEEDIGNKLEKICQKRFHQQSKNTFTVARSQME